MTVPYSLENFLAELKSHKSQVESHNFVMKNTQLVAVMLDTNLPADFTRNTIIKLLKQYDYSLDQRLSESLSTHVRNLRKARKKHARVH